MHIILSFIIFLKVLKQMKVVSLNVGEIRDVPWDGKIIQTGIYKQPVKGPIEVKGINIDGDNQGNRKTHGGVDRVVYAYPMEHYKFWKNQYPEKELPFGMFGENLTTEGLFENKVHVGDVFQIGTAEIMATQPRMPCYRLGIRFDDQKVMDKFLETDYCGIFFKIIQEGKLQADDEIKLLKTDPNEMSIVDIYYLMQNKSDKDSINKSLKSEHLSENLKERFQKLLEKE